MPCGRFVGVGRHVPLLPPPPPHWVRHCPGKNGLSLTYGDILITSFTTFYEAVGLTLKL